ncbi:glutamyl-tRNA synthetase [Achromatium sp. WMS3]|nr:glutamyl-tRNA synthetase [Achromatium sp. WMS3]
MNVRTRFAPSPTGYLHLGGARTALFSWLYARKHNGSFVLRIEDTDLERSTQKSVDAILEGMTWLGLDHDEGPFFQTQRFERYHAIINQLLAQDLAYYCNCSRERLDTIHQEQRSKKLKPRYDGHCRDRKVAPSSDYVIRFRNPETGAVFIDDMIKGRVIVQNSELDDLIIQRSNGTPTYNLSVVVDDMDMAITHVIRGDDHLNNTPRQMNIFRALGQEPPRYAHVPMILGPDRTRLSKRHGATSVMQYKEAGYLPEAMLNYLLRLGWAYGDQELFTRPEMIELFDLTQVHKAPAAFDPAKLNWLNQQYLINADPKRIAILLEQHFRQLDIDLSQGPDALAIVKAQQGRAHTLKELSEISSFWYQDVVQYDPKAASKHLRSTAYPILQVTRSKLADLKKWTAETIHQAIDQAAQESNVKMGKVAQPLRVAIVGRAASPGIDVTLALLDKETCLRRIDNALEYIQPTKESE